MPQFLSFLRSVDRHIKPGVSMFSTQPEYRIANSWFNGIKSKSRAAERGEIWFDNASEGTQFNLSGVFSQLNPIIPGPADVMNWRQEILEASADMHDSRAYALNKSEAQIYDMLKHGKAKVERDLMASLQRLAYNPLNADGRGIMGWREHFRFNLQANGTVTALDTPAPNGVRTLNADTGTVRSTYMGKDRAVAESLPSNFTITYANGSAFGKDEADRLRRLMAYSEIEPGFLMDNDGNIVFEQGIKQNSLVLAMPLQDKLNYLDYVGTRYIDGAVRDVASLQDSPIAGAKLMTDRRLDADPLLPNFLIDLNKFEWKCADPSKYLLQRRGPFPWSQNPADVAFYKYDIIGQSVLKSGNIQTAGATACRPGTMAI